MSAPLSTATSMRRLLLELVRHRPIQVVLVFVLGTVGYARAGVYVAATGGFVQALVDRDQSRALIWIGIYAAANLVEINYWPLRNLLADDVLDHATHRVQDRILQRASRAPLIDLESDRFFSRLQRANDNVGGHLMEAFRAIHGSLEVAVFFISILVPLWLIDPWIAIVLVLGMVPGAVAEYRTAKIFHDVRTHHAADDQFLARVQETLTDRHAAAEIRLFGAGAGLVDRWRTRRALRAANMIGAERRRQVTSFVGDGGVVISLAVALGIVVQRLIDGRVGIGAWTTVSMGIGWFAGSGLATATLIRAVRESSHFVGDLFAFEDEFGTKPLAPAIPVGGIAKPVESGMAIQASNVSFAYPDVEAAPVVDDVSLELRPGERVALVGENGAGKSTLVKLLAGLYAPASGRIELDGTGTTDPAASARQREIGAVFQDFVSWQFTARENIGIGNLDAMAEDNVVLRAAGQAGIADLIDDLPDGLDTILGREFGERDLSGGQWQRIAIARAFIRDARFLILDEPTAALDPLAEQRIFERFADLTAGKTALMISHRLGPARFADRILVMEAGRIVESGTHDDLMRREGVYARMFRAQAAWYNDQQVPIS